MRSQDDMTPMFDFLTDLTPQQRATLKERYRFMMGDYRRRCAIYAWLFYVLRITMTVGSLTVPAHIQYIRCRFRTLLVHMGAQSRGHDGEWPHHTLQARQTIFRHPCDSRTA